jgi:hypothetical protein
MSRVINGAVEASGDSKRGAGASGTVAIATVAVVKDQALPTVAAISTSAIRNGGATALPATASVPRDGTINPYK